MGEKEENLIKDCCLDQFITNHKKLVMERVLREGSRFITAVLKDIFCLVLPVH